MKLICEKCRTPFTIELEPLTIMNNQAYSVIIQRNMTVSCPNPDCREKFITQIHNCNVQNLIKGALPAPGLVRAGGILRVPGKG
jgi:hypothetical protein